jgi:isopropylmalate/homocitrate/citramalate synthase
MPFGERVEKRKAELAELLKSHTFEYLKKDIEYCNGQSPEKYWGYFIKSVNSGHYSSAELEKAKLKEQQKLKKKEQEEKLKKEQEEREQKLKMLIEKRFKELTDEELQEYENRFKALPNAVKKTTAKDDLIKEWIREEMKQARE